MIVKILMWTAGVLIKIVYADCASPRSQDCVGTKGVVYDKFGDVKQIPLGPITNQTASVSQF
jgi:hypothetical protein